MTPPTIVANVEGQLGSNGWYTGDVTVTWNVADPDSPIEPPASCETVVIAADTAGRTLDLHGEKPRRHDLGRRHCQARRNGADAVVRTDAVAPLAAERQARARPSRRPCRRPALRPGRVRADRRSG